MAAEKKAKGNAAKNIIMVLFVVAAALFVWKQIEKRQRIQKENEAIKVLDAGEFEKALGMFGELMKGATDEARKRHQTNIARCYVGLAEQDGLSLAEQMRYYREAAANDVSMIKNPGILKALEAERNQEKSGVGGDQKPVADKPAETTE